MASRDLVPARPCLGSVPTSQGLEPGLSTWQESTWTWECHSDFLKAFMTLPLFISCCQHWALYQCKQLKKTRGFQSSLHTRAAARMSISKYHYLILRWQGGAWTVLKVRKAGLLLGLLSSGNNPVQTHTVLSWLLSSSPQGTLFRPTESRSLPRVLAIRHCVKHPGCDNQQAGLI